MARPWPKYRALGWAFLTALLIGVMGTFPPILRAEEKASEKKSWTDSVSSSFQGGWNRLGKALNPKPNSTTVAPRVEDDSISLKSAGKPTPELYLSFARSYEQSGNLADAEQQYTMALDMKSDHLQALLGYAQLKSRLSQPDEAQRLYQRAAQAHPQNAVVHNNAGLFLAQRGRLPEATIAMNRAVQLDPKNRLYRNNIAALLVDQGRTAEAFGHLKEAHGEAAAHYNLGYMLNKKKQPQAARQEFALALKTDPSMEAARQWLAILEPATAVAATTAAAPNGPAPAQPMMAGGPTKPAAPSMPPTKAISMPPPEAAPQRLPPIDWPLNSLNGPVSPNTSPGADSSTAQAAPLPPPLLNSSLRPLPPVR